ncbi:MAG TPA: hypothetical protein VHX37_16050 [Acidobacteriaceae bacterium]|jgi:hypothetical protein|nr:hypothetical protein [Acidobacteriaceae bacterium]
MGFAARPPISRRDTPCRLRRDPHQRTALRLAARRILRRLGPCLLACASFRVASPQSNLPDAPAPQPDLVASAPGRPLASADPGAPAALGAAQTFPPEAPPDWTTRVPGLSPRFVPVPHPCITQACSTLQAQRSCCVQTTGVFSSYLNQNALHIYSPGELGRLAIRDTFDPFNLLTIGGTSAISVGEDAHTPYGPGFEGWARLSGVTFTEDMTGEFVGTFLIPSIDHQDPHYHREPNAPIPRRVLHCIVQPFWTDGDSGGKMVNYATLAGGLINEAVDISYVPYQQTGWGPSAERISLSWATAPIGNFVTEFVPDLANHFNVRVVFIQRIVNQVAVEEGGEP